MSFLEVKIYVMFFLSMVWADFVKVFTPDNLLKFIPAAVVTGFTIYKWYVLYQKRKNDKNIVE